MKRLAIISAAVLVTAACTEQEQTAPCGQGVPVVFKVSIQSTRAAADYPMASYFTLGTDFENATVNTGGVSAAYTYDNGLLVPVSEPVVFPADGSCIGRITVEWPSEALRLMQSEQGALKDQSTSLAFFSSDWLRATLNNVVPSTVIPVSFDHERCKITFAVVGENAGRKIKSLTIAGFKAYCDPDTAEAQLIYDFQYDRGSMPAGTAGVIELEGIDGPIDIMILDSPDDMLTGAGDNCTVNLNL